MQNQEATPTQFRGNETDLRELLSLRLRKMAEASISVDQDQFSCPVCLDLLKEPVTTPCGHSFCMVCINGYWDQDDQRGVYSCPQCRETFTPRPVLRRNNMLAEVVEKLKKTELQAASPAHCYAGPGDVECDYCTGRKRKAIKSCLVCLASYCETHLKPHYQSPAFKKHKLVEASKQLQEKICPQHDEVMKIYCRTDHSCICYLCTMEEHKGHDTVSAAAERREKQSRLKRVQRKSQQRLQEKEKKLQEVKQAVKTLKSSAQAAVEDSERIFTELIRSIEKKRSEVTELIRAQEEAELSGAEELLEQLEQEIADLKMRDTELEQLSHTEDHIHFLQSFQSLCVSSGSEDSPSITVHQHLSFDGVRKSLSDLKERLEEFCKQEFSKISPHVAAVQMILPSDPTNKEYFLQYFCHLTLDPNTVQRYLSLSEKNRVVMHSKTFQRYSDHPERFDCWKQVLSKESVSGRCYWEVECSKGLCLYISVSYKGISRKGRGDESWFGHNSQSWSLRCSSSLSFWHNNIETELSATLSSRIGVTRKPLLLSSEDTKLISESCSLSVCECRKMAEASISVDQDQFSCPVCLDLLKDPVTTPCGHSFCMVCINGCWDQEDQRGVYSCPQCRETFTPRPVLRRNNMLAEVVEKLKKTELQAASPAHCYAGPGDVECDFCTERKRKAIKSCLVCVASFCEAHLKPHLEIPALIKHKLVTASSKLQEKVCSQHDKLIEIYCRTDHSCICYLCMMEEHRGHDAVAASAERNQKQSEVKDMQRKSQQRLQEKEKMLQEVKQAVETLKSSAQAAVEDSERIFTELIRSIEKKRSEVTELIRAQEEAELSGAEELLEQLEQEIADLKRRDTELEQLSHTEDHIHFLQSFQSLCVSSGSEDSPSITVHPNLSFDGVRKSLSDLKERLEEFCKQEFSKISPHVSAVQMILPSEPKTRADFLQYFCRLTLDPNTVNYYLSLSEENRVVTCSKNKQCYSDHPERFDYWYQVLSKESVSGRCYWEVEWSNSKGYGLYISVSYKGISRKGRGNECRFGHNSQSWSLQCSPSLSFYHNNIQTEISASSSSRIGVYVDHSAGTLSFYSVSDTMTLLHTVHTTFTQPLYAGFDFGNYGSAVRLCDPK
ncbi:E3 ubiquitin/ISG15 ligase TRIM25-like [Colossoma macropomum]|uniref:E3 ubiquitin/ISG15 ligase TRIM25-like n=1 Tax=Colossoma macropomum TaxID=42526 RepID=UPI0018650130|nr:E3 ubiquitin/ISG15 ligase TRIM25-like [Colossoma macropomum]